GDAAGLGTAIAVVGGRAGPVDAAAVAARTAGVAGEPHRARRPGLRARAREQGDRCAAAAAVLGVRPLGGAPAVGGGGAALGPRVRGGPRVVVRPPAAPGPAVGACAGRAAALAHGGAAVEGGAALGAVRAVARPPAEPRRRMAERLVGRAARRIPARGVR